MLNFLFEVGHEVRVYRKSVTISFRIFWWKIASCENVLFEGKTRDKYVFAVRWSLSYLYTRWLNLLGIYIMYINLEINKSNVKRGNLVCQIEGHKQ